MAGCKKKIKQIEHPQGKQIFQGANPTQYYDEHPSWNFSDCDKEKWSLNSVTVHDLFWEEILPRLQNLEKQTWQDILVTAKKQNHSVSVANLNKVACDRLEELYIEAEAVISLRVNGTHRIYGLVENGVFHIIWIDLAHGDNDTCVCRSYKKHT